MHARTLSILLLLLLGSAFSDGLPLLLVVVRGWGGLTDTAAFLFMHQRGSIRLDHRLLRLPVAVAGRRHGRREGMSEGPTGVLAPLPCSLLLLGRRVASEAVPVIFGRGRWFCVGLKCVRSVQSAVRGALAWAVWSPFGRSPDLRKRGCLALFAEFCGRASSELL